MKNEYIIRVTVLTFFTISFSLNANFAQAQNLDSLLNGWQDETQVDSSRSNAYYEYVWEGFLFGNPDTAFILAQNLVRFGEEQQYSKAKAKGFNIQGMSFRFTRDYPKALEYINLSLKIYEEIEDKKGITSSLDNIGIIYYSQGNYPKALDYQMRGLKIEEEMGDKQGASGSLVNIGSTYMIQDNYPEALNYYNSALIIKEEIGDKQDIANSLGTIGSVYYYQGDYSKALDYQTRSLKI